MAKTTTSQTAKKKDAARLTRIREALGFSMRGLAKEWKIDHSTVSKWESAKEPIPGTVLKLIELYEQKLGIG